MPTIRGTRKWTETLMIIRLFIALLLLNAVAFVVRAEAGEHEVLPREMYTESVRDLQHRMAGDFVYDGEDALFDLGARLLSWKLAPTQKVSRHYASDPMAPDHSIALINEGAALNLSWRF